jgi:hypothetical protein
VAGCDGNTICGNYPPKKEEDKDFPGVYKKLTRVQI